MRRCAFYIGTWVQTPDGEGEVRGYDSAQDRPYYVFLDIAGADASADNLRTYAAVELTRLPPPRWKQVRDSK